METRKLVIFIVGPTASGKTDVAIDLAQKHSGEIICADSRTVYKHLDIGTAKPNVKQRQLVPHWGLDLVEPNEKYSASRFQKYAKSKIEEIQNRGGLPIVVGGTGLYIDGLLFNYKFGPAPDEELRKSLQSFNTEELIGYCRQHNIELPSNINNKRRLIRSIEQQGVNRGRDEQPNDNYIIVGITTNKETLNKNIVKRTEKMLENGVLKEAEDVASKYSWDCPPMMSNIYLYINKFIHGELDGAQVFEQFILSEQKLVKKQLTWFKRNNYINWLEKDDVTKFIEAELAKVQGA